MLSNNPKRWLSPSSSAALFLALAGIPVSAIRTTDIDVTTGLMEDDSITEAAQVSNDIDWSFMSDKFTYNARGSSAWGWVKRAVFDGRSRTENLKDEIAKEHYCSQRGTRDETYYSASLCYWIPDIPDPDMTKSFGLRWQGGKSNGKELCESIPDGQGGRCVKCGVCHNNARSGSGEVTATAFIEPIILGECKTEKDIEALMEEGFKTENPDLTTQHEECVTLESVYDQKSTAFQANEDRQASLSARQGTITNEIHSLQLDKSYKAGELQSYDNDVMSSRRTARSICSLHAANADWWWKLDDSSYSNENIISDMRRSIRCQGQWDRHCLDCQEALYVIEEDYNRGNFLRDEMRSLEEQVVNLQREQTDNVDALQQLQAAHPGLKAERDAAETQWMSQKTSCTRATDDYRVGMASKMEKSVADHYDDSCEKACVSQKNNGCGVLEGVDVPQLGGLQGICDPPTLSWVKGSPYNYVQDPRSRTEQLTEQCSRIFAEQRPAKAQSVLMEGKLWKRERLWNRWRQRYFVFESGDAVRSAMLRYWRKDPNSHPDEPERYVQGIVLWDAKRVKTKPLRHYGWKDDTACFKLYHFYREYRLCVAPEDGGASVRAQWVQNIELAIVFPAVVDSE